MMENNTVLSVKNLHVHYVTSELTAKAVNGKHSDLLEKQVLVKQQQLFQSCN